MPSRLLFFAGVALLTDGCSRTQPHSSPGTSPSEHPMTDEAIDAGSWQHGIGSTKRLVSDPHSVAGDPSIVRTAEGFTMVWSTKEGFEVQRLDANGASIAPRATLKRDWWWTWPVVAGAGVAWTEHLGPPKNMGGPPGKGDIPDAVVYFGKIDGAGQLGPSPIRLSHEAGECRSPSIVVTNSSFAVAWSQTREEDGAGNEEIYFSRITPDGHSSSRDIRVTHAPGTSYLPSLAYSGDGYGIAWSDERDKDWDIYFATLDAEGKSVGETRLTSAIGEDTQPSLVWANGAYRLVYVDGGKRVQFVSIDKNGRVLGGRVALSARESALPTLIVNVNELWVTWSTHTSRWPNEVAEIHFVRLDLSGNRIGNDMLVATLHAGVNTARIAPAPGGAAIVWSEIGSGDPQPMEAYFARISISRM